MVISDDDDDVDVGVEVEVDVDVDVDVVSSPLLFFSYPLRASRAFLSPLSPPHLSSYMDG